MLSMSVSLQTRHGVHITLEIVIQETIAEEAAQQQHLTVVSAQVPHIYSICLFNIGGCYAN